MARRAFTSLLILSLVISLVFNQQVDRHEFVEGSAVIIYCNASTAAVESSSTLVKSTVLLLVTDTGDVEMAFLQQRDGVNAAISRKINGSNVWTFTMPARQDLETQLGELSNNRDSMNIIASNNNARCSDSGIYKCIVQYVGPSGGTLTSEKDTNYTGRGLVSNQEISMLPAGNDYTENTTLTIKCIASGPGTYEFQWHKRCPTANVSTMSQYVSWPSPSDLHELVSELEIRQNDQPSDCGTYKHRQELRFRAQLEDNKCDIRCQFGSAQNGFKAELSSHVTILVKRQEGNKTSSDDGLNTGALIGIIVAAILIVALAIILCICYVRKRRGNASEGRKKYSVKKAEERNLEQLNVATSNPVDNEKEQPYTYADGFIHKDPSKNVTSAPDNIGPRQDDDKMYDHIHDSGDVYVNTATQFNGVNENSYEPLKERFPVSDAPCLTPVHPNGPHSNDDSTYYSQPIETDMVRKDENTAVDESDSKNYYELQ